jgi:DNA-binding MarR family transcriptional regulator
MKDELKKKLVQTIFGFKSIGMTFSHGIKRGDAGVNLAEIALMKGIVDNTLASDGAKIQEALCIKKAAVSQMLGVLEKKGYLKRDINKDNRRKIVLSLTEKGETIIKETEKTIDLMLSKIISDFGEKETMTFIQQFERLSEIITNSIHY